MNRPPRIDPQPLPPMDSRPPGSAPPAPRPITPKVRRRSWWEPAVRTWWLSSAALVLIGIIFVGHQALNYRSQVKLINNGITVTATVVEAQGTSRHGVLAPPGSEFGVSFDWKGSTVKARTSSEDYVTVDKQITLHVNPDDPTDFTDRTAPEPFFRGLIAGVVVLVVLAGTLVAAWVARRRVLNTWRDGISDIFTVLDARHTALAPQSHQVRCLRANGSDPRIVTVYVPKSAAQLHEGDLLWLVYPRNNQKGALAAVAYV